MNRAALAQTQAKAVEARESRTASGGLRIGEADDATEREADRVADAVLSGGSPRWSLSALSIGAPLQRKCDCGGQAEGACESCRDKRGALQRKPGDAAAAPAYAPPSVEAAIRAAGRPLEPGVRGFMEGRFGRSFSDVRVHDDAAAARSALAIGASAYTVSNAIVFGPGRYSPGSAEGLKLLAHELAHVAQFSRSPGARDKGVVARQPASASPGAGGMMQPVYLDRSHFEGRYDALVNPRSHSVTLIMNVGFEMGSWGNRPDKDSALQAFKPKLKAVVEREWSLKYDLQPACAGAGDKFHAYVTLNVDGGNPHANIRFFPDTGGGRSSAGDGEGALQESDADPKELTRPFRPRPGAKPVSRTFVQYTAAHEFGHLLGLPHPHCKGNADQCYGVTPDEAMDVMGMGTFVSQRDYAPFQKIMTIYGEGRYPGPCNGWKLVEVG